MQGSSRPDRELLDVAALCAHLVPEGSVYAFLAEHRLWLFPDEMFADLFATKRGRPSVPADQVATVMVLQALEGLSDREAVRQLETNLVSGRATGQQRCILTRRTFVNMTTTCGGYSPYSRTPT
jgi:hypothetical protein